MNLRHAAVLAFVLSGACGADMKAINDASQKAEAAAIRAEDSATTAETSANAAADAARKAEAASYVAQDSVRRANDVAQRLCAFSATAWPPYPGPEYWRWWRICQSIK